MQLGTDNSKEPGPSERRGAREEVRLEKLVGPGHGVAGMLFSLE